jgi:hypothetical protein
LTISTIVARWIVSFADISAHPKLDPEAQK